MESREFKELKSPGYVIYINSGDTDSVLELQKQLNKWGYTDGHGRKLAEDGDYGINTYNAVIKYQRDHGLYEDGKVGDKTWESMYQTIKDEELNFAAKSGNIHAYYAESGLNIDGMDKFSYPETSSKKKTDGFNIGKAFGAFRDYTKMYEDLNDKVESDGEVQNAQEREAESADNNALLEPAVKMPTEEDVEFIEENGYHAWLTMQKSY